jgi:N-formylglutamate deformylase
VAARRPRAARHRATDVRDSLSNAALVYDSPHSGRIYPRDWHPAVPVARLRIYEDRFVDRLIAGAAAQGAVLVTARHARSWIDVNRAPDDLADDIAGPDWPAPLRPSAASARGTGLIFRDGPGGAPLHPGPLPAAEIARRLERGWHPYHRTLDAALDRAQARAGQVWHLNWHSMLPVGADFSPDPGTVRPDVVLGDLFGQSCAPAFVDLVERAFVRRGYGVARNRPFAGGYIVARHGRPEAGRHSLQIELNRALYLDLATLELSAGAARLCDDIAAITAELAAFAAAG